MTARCQASRGRATNVLRPQLESKKQSPFSLLLGLAVGLTACGSRPISGVADDDDPPEEPRSGGSGVTLVSLSTAVNPGDRLKPLTLRRHNRDAVELEARVNAVARLVTGQTMQSSLLSSWAQNAVSERHEIASIKPYGAHPTIVVTYRPYLDYLTVVDGSVAAGNGNVFSRTAADQIAENAMSALGTAGVTDGDYVQVRTGAIGFVTESQAPYASEYVNHFSRVEHGFILNDSWVELHVNADYQVSRIAVRDIEVVAEHEDRRAMRSTVAAAAALDRHLQAKMDAISPSLDATVLSDPVPAYHIDPGAEENVAVYPEVSVRWMSMNAGKRSRSSVAVYGLHEHAVPRLLYPGRYPSFCNDFRTGRKIATDGTVVVVDTVYASSFVHPRNPINECQEARLFVDPGTNNYALRGVVPGEPFHQFGLQDGDHSLVLCSTDTGASSYGTCASISDDQSIYNAYAALSDSSTFDLTLQRGTSAATLEVELAACPTVAGVVDCSALL